MANSMDPDQTAPIGPGSGPTLFASILNLSVILGNYLQQTNSADKIFQMHFFLGALRVNNCSHNFEFCFLVPWFRFEMIFLNVGHFQTSTM